MCPLRRIQTRNLPFGRCAQPSMQRFVPRVSYPEAQALCYFSEV